MAYFPKLRQLRQFVNFAADVFTKATDKGTFTKMRGHLMNINAALRGEIAKSMQHATGELKRIISRMSRY